MPYTPPSQQSPAGSGPHSPTLSRSHSYGHAPVSVDETTSPSSPSSRPTVVRSTSSISYLTRHRRTPSVSSKPAQPTVNTAVATARPWTHRDNASTNSRENADEAENHKDNGLQSPTGRDDGRNWRHSTKSGSIKQSPPPASGKRLPPHAIMSPPDSMQASSEESTPPESSGHRIANIAELQEAIRNIERQRDSYADGAADGEDDFHGDSPQGVSHAASSRPPSASWRECVTSPPPLTRDARKISHSRSSTESAIRVDAAAKPQSPSSSSASSAVASPDDSDGAESPTHRPIMVRKKSGELVKPALRPPSRRRPSSMPGTPTYAKAVHFDAHLEHVRHFLQLDRPLAVSAGSSPAENHDTDSEYPFAADDMSQSRSFEWEIVLSNFPPDTLERRSLPVRVERVYLSKDKKSLLGAVAVANLAFHKSVVARFTLDYWKTTSEVAAEYDFGIRDKAADGYDRFVFTIKLSDLAHLENKTLFFCVRYSVAGREFWDNNNAMNFQVAFIKKAKLVEDGAGGMRHGLGARPAHAIARGRAAAGRPWSMPASFDDFADGFDPKYDFCDMKLGTSKFLDDALSPTNTDPAMSRDSSIPDYPTRRTHRAGQAFGNRYDFGASLTAAIQAANASAGRRSVSLAPSADRAATNAKTKSEGPDGAPPKAADRTATPTSTSSPPVSPKSHAAATGGIGSGRENILSTFTKPVVTSTFPRPESYISEKPSQQSSTYLELIDKYCFVRSGTPQRIVGKS